MSRKDSRISAHTSLHVVLKGERQETRSLRMQGCVGGGMDSMLFNTDYRSKIGRQYRNFGSPDKTFRTGSKAFANLGNLLNGKPDHRSSSSLGLNHGLNPGPVL